MSNCDHRGVGVAHQRLITGFLLSETADVKLPVPRHSLTLPLFLPFPQRHRLNGGSQAERQHAENQRQAMGSKQVIEKDLNPPDQRDEHGHIANLAVAPQIGEDDDAGCRAIYEHRLGTPEGIPLHLAGQQRDRLMDADAQHVEAAGQSSEQKQYGAPVVPVEPAEDIGCLARGSRWLRPGTVVTSCPARHDHEPVRPDMVFRPAP